MRYIKTVIALFIFTITISAQDAFHRIYPFTSVDSLHIVTDGIQLSDDSYVTIGRDSATDTTAYASILTRYNIKGDLVYSNKIYLADSTHLLNTSEVTELSDGNIAYSGGINTEDNANVVVGVDRNTGEPIWSRSMGDNFVLSTTLKTYPNDKIIAGATKQNSPSEFNIWLSMLNNDGSVDWTKEYDATESISGLDVEKDMFATKVSEIDSSIFVSGTASSGLFSSYHLTKVDKEGEVVWSNSYTTNPPGLLIQPDAIVEMPDSSVYVSGLVFFFDGQTLIFNSWLAKHDSIGTVEWSRVLTQPTDFSLSMGLAANGENLALAVQTIDDLFTPGAPSFPAIVEIDTAGTLVGAQSYSITNTNFNIFGSLVNTSDEGLALFSTHTSPTEGIVADIIKTNIDFETTCSEDTTARFEDLPLLATALTWTSTDIMDIDTLETDVTRITYYDIPTISPEAEIWCPNEPIVDTLDATPSPLPEGEISYEWSTGEMSSSIVAMEEGEYMVTVTIRDDHCYKLCDTVNVSTYQLPTAAIGQDDSPYCATQTVNLIAQIGADAGIQSVTWSTGENTPTINVDTEGTYTVTVVDLCDEVATASIDVIFPPDLESLDVAFTTNEDCVDFSATIIATTNVNNSTDLMFDWSNGAQTSTISVDEAGLYIVTATNCNITLIDSVDVKLPENINRLEYPRVFFPDGELELNRTFGPNNPCDLPLDSYELKIYNRWGNEVFSSTAIEEEWDGNYNGSAGQSAVYVWYAKYTVTGEGETVDKGDVTLIRKR